MKLVFILVIISFIKCVWAHKTFKAIPLIELKRRKREGDKAAGAIYRVAAFGRSFDVLIFSLGAASAILLILWSARTSWWAGVVAILFVALLTFYFPKASPGGISWRLAVLASGAYAKVFGWLEQVLQPIAKILPSDAEVHMHTGLYSKEDLLELLNKQNTALDNRIPEGDLKAAFGALTFGDKTVGKTMTPFRKVRFVAENEVVGPMLMDELHATGFSRFPVTAAALKDKDAQPKVTGTLYLKELIEHPDKPKVKDLMRKDAYFINESCTLHQALDAFLLTHHHLLVVVNKFEEIVGVLTMEDVLEQIVGSPIVDEFDKYDDLRAAAAHDANADKAEHREIKPEESTAEPESVVE